MELWCVDCMMDGRWTTAETLAKGDALCARHALEERFEGADQAAGALTELDAARANRR